MKEPALVIIKPDGISKGLIGCVLDKFAESGLKIVAMRIVKISRKDAEEHYKHLKGKTFFEETVAYFCGEFHDDNRLVMVIYYGEKAIEKCRKIAGATNPEKADLDSVRGAFGRITTKGVYENVVHVSSNSTEAEREIKLWFKPDDILINIYQTKNLTKESAQERIWV